MKSMVNELVAMIGGSANGKSSYLDSGKLGKRAKRSLRTPVATEDKAVKKIVAHKAKEVNPHQIMPLDDTDFQDF